MRGLVRAALTAARATFSAPLMFFACARGSLGPRRGAGAPGDRQQPDARRVGHGTALALVFSWLLWRYGPHQRARTVTLLKAPYLLPPSFSPSAGSLAQALGYLAARRTRWARHCPALAWAAPSPSGALDDRSR